ncbi:hypothetical protein BDV18DRAFT_143744 [Aspergillus unguis]
MSANIPADKGDTTKLAANQFDKSTASGGYADETDANLKGEEDKPHSSKIMNKLDPRYDSDMLEEQEKGKLGGQQNKPGVSKD